MKKVFDHDSSIVEMCLFDTYKEMNSFLKINSKLLNTEMPKTKGFSKDDSFIVILEYDRRSILDYSQIHSFASFDYARMVFLKAYDTRFEEKTLFRLIEDSIYLVNKELL